MDDNQLILPVESSTIQEALPVAPDFRSEKRKILVVILAVAFLTGIGFAFLALSGVDSRILDVVLQIPLAANILRWCLVDAKEREIFIGKTMRFSIVIFTPIAFPIYVFRSRGIAGFRTLFLAILFYALAIFFVMLGGLAVIFALVSTGLVSLDI